MALVSTTATTDAVRRRLQGRRLHLGGTVFQALLLGALLLSILILVVLVIDVVAGAWGVLTTRLGSFLSGTLQSRPEVAGIAQGLRGSAYIAVFVVVLAFPIGIAAGIYLEEYAPRSRFTRFVDVNIRNLAGVPSVVYGILGLAIFVGALATLPDWLGGGPLTGGRTVMSAGITLAILVLPIVIITSAEAIRAVPDSIREAGFGVGATRWEVVRSHVLPYAVPGILTGTILSLARALGEAAPLILVGAVTGRLASGGGGVFEALQERFTAMPIIITTWAGRPQNEFQQSLAPAAIVVLLVVVLLANAAAILLRDRYEKRR